MRPLLFLLSLLLLGTAPAQQVGEAAPDFRLVDEAGEAVTLADFSGTPLVLNFWASWCAPCVEELPFFQETFEAHGEAGKAFQFLLVNNNESADKALTFLRDELGITLPAALDAPRDVRRADNLDTTLDVIKRYRARGMPATYFIDAEGTVRAVKQGFLLESEAPQLFESIGVELP